MYAALITGIANYLCKNFNYTPKQVKYGGTDDFWNKFHLDRLKTPGVIYGVSQVTFPKGLSAHQSIYLGPNNFSETSCLKVRPILVSVDMTLGMLADNENDHFDQIHKYVEMGAFNARLVYKVKIPGVDNLEEWESTVTNFSELSPAPTGRETNTYDPEGRIYKLEGTFSVNTQFFMTEEKKVIRCLYIGDSNDSEAAIETIGHDSSGNKFPNSVYKY